MTDTQVQKRGRGRPRKNKAADKPVEGPKPLLVCFDVGNGTIVVAVMTPDGTIHVFRNKNGDSAIPALIGFEEGDPEKVLVGRPCNNLIKLGDGQYVATCAKRLRGTPEIPLIVDAQGKQWTARELETLLLLTIAREVEERFGMPIGPMLMTVPANYTTAEREATMQLASDAGLNCVGVINEPTAAMLNYAQDKSGLAICDDSGAGTTDVTIAQIEDGEDFTNLATAGRNDIGGEEYSTRLYQYAVAEAERKGIALDLETNARDCALLKLACEDAKKELSTQARSVIACTLAGTFFELEISQAKFESLTEDISASIAELVESCLKRAKLEPAQFDHVVFAGGNNLSPFATKRVEAMFQPSQIRRDIDPEHAIALGGCRAIGLKIRERIAAGDSVLKGETEGLVIPTITEIREITGKTLGVRAMSLSRNKDVMSTVIPQGAQVGTEHRRTYGLMNGDKGSVSAKIVVLEGEDNCDPSDATLLAEFPLDGLPAGPVENRVEVTFHVDTDGLCHVRAVDTVSGKSITESVRIG